MEKYINRPSDITSKVVHQEELDMSKNLWHIAEIWRNILTDPLISPVNVSIKPRWSTHLWHIAEIWKIIWTDTWYVQELVTHCWNLKKYINRPIVITNKVVHKAELVHTCVVHYWNFENYIMNWHLYVQELVTHW